MIATALRYPQALRRCGRTAVAIGNYRAPAAAGQTGTISGGSRRLSLRRRMEPLLRGADGPDLRPRAPSRPARPTQTAQARAWRTSRTPAGAFSAAGSS